MARTPNYEFVKRWRANLPKEVLRAKRLAESRAYRAKYPEKLAANSKRYRERHIEKLRTSQMMKAREYRKGEKYQESQRLRMAKFKAKEEALLLSIAGRPRPECCELCGQKTKTAFDHDHATGAFRGWLCWRCNRSLGQVHDDVGLLLKMADYVTKGGFGHGSIDAIQKKQLADEHVRATERAQVSPE